MKYLYPFLILVLAGCVPPIPLPPYITDISNADSTVKVTASNNGDRAWGVLGKWPTMEAINAEAEHGCSTFNKTAVSLSWGCSLMLGAACWEKTYLFSCKVNN